MRDTLINTKKKMTGAMFAWIRVPIGAVSRLTRRQRLFAALIALIFLIPLILRGFLLTREAGAAWYNDNWSFRKRITIDSGQVSGSSDLTDFPVLVSFEDNDLETNAQSNGDDILFTSSDGSTKLSHEIESYSDGTLVAWVKVPTLDFDDDTDIYMYYGNATASNQENATDVWSNSYAGVWHLKESGDGTADEFTDSTSNANHGQGGGGTASAVPTLTDSGKVNGAQEFDGDDDRVRIGDHATLQVGNSWSVSAWIKWDGNTDENTILAKQYGSGSDNSYAYWIDSGGAGNITFKTNDSGGGQTQGTATGVVTQDVWLHTILTWDGTDLVLYVDGTSAQTASGARTTAYDTNPLFIGEDSNDGDDPPTDSLFFGGLIDEARVSSTDRSADWIATEYNNQSSPSSFYSIQGEEKATSPALWLKFDEAQGTTANDSTANANNGTISGATWQTKESCAFENCLSFDGTDDVVTVTNANPIDFDSGLSSGFTIASWVRVNSDGENNTGEIFTKGANTYLRIANEGTDGKADLVANLDLATTDATVTATDGITLNKWHHVLLTHDGTSTITLYIDGVEKGTNTGSGAKASDANNLLVGGGTTTNFHGFIDEFKVYPYVRSSDEILVDYLGGANVLGIQDHSFLTDGLVGYWKMDESSGTNASDSSGNANDGTLTNMQETGTATNDANTTDTVLRDDGGGSLSSTDDVYNGMTLYITDNATCGLSSDEQRTISDYDGTNKDITVSSAFSADLDACDYTIRHQTGGKFGNGIGFDRANDYINAGTNSTLAPETHDYTFGAWIKYNEASCQADDCGIAGTNTNYRSEGFFFSIKEISLRLNLMLHDGTNFVDATADSTGIPPADEWAHIAFTLDSSTKTALVYLNGVVVGTIDYSEVTGSIDIGGNLHIGSRDSNGEKSIYGNIDDVRIYNRALSPAEVRALYSWAPGPVGYWNFDEGTGTSIVYDRSGNGNDGTMNGSMTESDWVAGKFGSALEFDGTDDYISMGDPADGSLDLGTGNFTVNFWTKYYTPTGASGDEYAVTKRPGGTGAGWAVGIDSFTGEIVFRIDDGTNAFADEINGSYNLRDSEWHHVTIIYDRTNGFAYGYVDGQLKGNDDISSVTGSVNNNISFNINSANDTIISSENHALYDEVRIYNYARTQQQIIEDMNAGHPTGGSPIGSQVAYWSFDEMYGDTANDKIGSNNGDLGGSGQTCPASGTVPCPTWTTDGKINSALTFDGTDDLINMGSDNSIDNIFSGGGTVTAWININGFGETGNGRILNKTNGTDADTGWLFYTRSSSGGLSFYRAFGVGATDQGQWTAGTISTGTWYHVAVVYNEDSNENDPDIYINGVSETVTEVAAPTGSAISDASQDLVVGNDDTGARSFDGLIDEVKIYNSALTQDQILIDYAGGASTSFSVLGDSEASDLSDGAGDPPVGHWTFDEKTGTSANDRSGNGNTGTLGGDGAGSDVPTWQHSGNCHKGPCLEFDGSDDQINAGSDSSLDNISNLTVSGWIYPHSDGESNIGRIVDKDERWRVTVNLDDGTNTYLTFWSNWDGDDANYRSTNRVVPLNEWTHIAVTYEFTAGTQPIIYINGSSVSLTESSASTGSYLGDATQDLYIGNRSVGDGTFDGLLDDIRIYDYELTQSQVSYLYNRGGPVGHWKFDECEGTTANDVSGNGNNGTITPGDSTGDNDSAGTCSSGASDPTNEMWNDGTNGKRNASLGFDGTNDYVTMGDQDELIGDNYSFTFWINPHDSETDKSILYKIVNSSPCDGILVWRTSLNRLQVFVDSCTANVTVSNYFTEDTWIHTTVVLDDGTIYIYKDGSLVSSSGTYTSVTDNDVDFEIARQGDLGRYINAQIDDVKIFNYALSPAQIRKEYNAGAVFFGPSEGSP